MNGTLMCDAELEIVEFDGLAGIGYDFSRRLTFCWSISDPGATLDDC